MYSTVLQDIENDQKIVLKKERALVSCPTYKNGECVQSDAVFEFEYLLFLVIASQPQLVQAWNDHYDKEDGEFNKIPAYTILNYYIF